MIESQLIIIKNLIENKEFKKAYQELTKIEETYDVEIVKIRNTLLYFNFGNALYLIDEVLFNRCKLIEHEEKLNNIEGENFTDNYEEYEEYEEYETYDDYNDSYAQGQENLSDQFINNVLEGDPDNYWNID